MQDIYFQSGGISEAAFGTVTLEEMNAAIRNRGSGL
jgi:hypothetical protein